MESTAKSSLSNDANVRQDPKTVKIGGFEVNRLGYGAMRITGKHFFSEPSDPANAKKVLQRAVELGVNFIDTADCYGPAVSERLIGEALAPYKPGLVIAQKLVSSIRDQTEPIPGLPLVVPNISFSR